MDALSYLTARAERYEEIGDYESAERLWTVVLSMEEKKWGKDSLNLTKTMYNFGMLYFALENYSKAEQLLMKCLEIERKCLPSNHPDISETVNALTSIHLERYFSRANSKRAKSA